MFLQTKVSGYFFFLMGTQVFIMFPEIAFKVTSEDWNYNYLVLPPEFLPAALVSVVT